MNDLQNIVDFELHPINDLNSYVKYCRSELQENGILVLKKFLAKGPLFELQREAQKLHGKAYYCSRNHNVLLTERNFQLGDKHPCNIDVTSNKGCVPHDLIPQDSHLRSIYGHCSPVGSSQPAANWFAGVVFLSCCSDPPGFRMRDGVPLCFACLLA